MLLGQELSKSSPAVPPGLIYKICISSHAYHHTRPLLTKPSLRLTYLKSFPPHAAETGSLSVCPRKSIPAGFNLLHSHPLQLSVKQISNSTYSSSSVYKKFITASLYCQVFFCFFFSKYYPVWKSCRSLWIVFSFSLCYPVSILNPFLWYHKYLRIVFLTLPHYNKRRTHKWMKNKIWSR